VHLLVPLLVGDLGEMLPDAHAGVVDEDVERPRYLQRRFGEMMRTLGRGKVGRRSPGLDLERAHGGDGLVDVLLLATVNEDAGPLAGEPFGNHPSDTARAAAH